MCRLGAQELQVRRQSKKTLDLDAEKSLSIHSCPNFPKTKINLIVYLRYCTDNMTL